MDPENTKTQEELDEEILDQELEKSISSVQAGEVLQTKTEDKPETPEGGTPTEPKVEEPSNPPAEAKEGDSKYEFKLPIPSKTKFESDEAYEKRVELMDLIEKRKAAITPEQKAKLSEEIKQTRKEMSLLNPNGNITNPLNNNAGDTNGYEDPTIEADKERLKELGGATKEDVESIVQQKLQAIEVKTNIDNFINRHKEMSDPDVREVFFDFVDQNYIWQNKSGKDFLATLEMAYENMFRPSETIQERVLKSANVQEKVNAMQFPGGTIAKPGLSPEMQKSVEEIMATGKTEAEALELLSD